VKDDVGLRDAELRRHLRTRDVPGIGHEPPQRGVENVRSKERSAAFMRGAATDPLRALFFAPERNEPFAALQSLAEEGL
jgi:hypothetical protein